MLQIVDPNVAKYLFRVTKVGHFSIQWCCVCHERDTERILTHIKASLFSWAVKQIDNWNIHRYDKCLHEEKPRQRALCVYEREITHFRAEGGINNVSRMVGGRDWDKNVPNI